MVKGRYLRRVYHITHKGIILSSLHYFLAQFRNGRRLLRAGHDVVSARVSTKGVDDTQSVRNRCSA